jgi:CheY-like chemotaxis protein
MPPVVLVIDDSPLRLAMIGEALRGDDATPVLAGGADAMSALERGPRPDVVVIDLDLRDGLAVLAQLEAAVEGLVPVVALTSEPRRLLEAGVADAVLAKPFDLGQVRASVRRALERRRPSRKT